MKYVPSNVSRFASRSLLKVSAKSPTILVVSGVVGLGAAAVLAARATRKIDPVLEDFEKNRQDVRNTAFNTQRDQQKALLDVYTHTGVRFAKIYGPAILIGTASAVSVLGGHKILVGRHVASMAAYSGLFQEFNAYRKRVADTFGEEREQDLYNGAKLAYVEDPDHKGEYKLESQWPEGKREATYLRPWFDAGNCNWVKDPESNYYFLLGIQNHMNNVYKTRGHVFLNDIMDALRMPRSAEGQKAGWFRDDEIGDGFIDFGLSDRDPHTVAFRNGLENTVQLNFNIDGDIYEKLLKLNARF